MDKRLVAAVPVPVLAAVLPAAQVPVLAAAVGCWGDPSARVACQAEWAVGCP